MEESFDQMSAEVDQNTVDKQCVEIERKNLLIANENLIVNSLSNQLLFAIEQSLVNSSTVASRSKPRSNTKNNRYLSANSVNQKTVKDYPMTNKSVWTKVNRVDSSISSKRVVINLNSESMCKMCNKCLISMNHDMCALKSLNSMNATPLSIILNKGKHIWKPKGKLSDNSLKKTKRVWKATSKLFANVGYQWRPTGKKFALGEQCPLTKHHVKCCSKHMTRNHSKLKNFVEKFIGTVRFGNDHFGAIMGYGDYVYDDSVISGVYYVEELGQNLFSVGQFCDSDLEIAFRKHSCFVHDMNGVDLLKEAVATACYTQNRSLIHTRHNKTPYELVHDNKADLSFLRVFGALCYRTNDSEDLGKLQDKADIGIFVGYAPSRKVFLILNKRTHRIMEQIHVTFDELLQSMAPVHISSGPELMSMMPGQFSSGLIPNQVHATNYVLPSLKDWSYYFIPSSMIFEVT
ncbi:retrovirus-related pol polyprotein from transposon TNT 1-94 [Tanacetum coccineum]|uniref:Retrovirus-related pol polyprotein from transposon TNT 1-94 n=1 Tax=Tanacetum coccineum TaxID=301880 RepID=A0ABQ5B0Q7_9ASTR